ncbi:hypothetical protein Vretimale_19574, partial [Volvox reticuliferus]
GMRAGKKTSSKEDSLTATATGIWAWFLSLRKRLQPPYSSPLMYEPAALTAPLRRRAQCPGREPSVAARQRRRPGHRQDAYLTQNRLLQPPPVRPDPDSVTPSSPAAAAAPPATLPPVSPILGAPREPPPPPLRHRHRCCCCCCLRPPPLLPSLESIRLLAVGKCRPFDGPVCGDGDVND